MMRVCMFGTLECALVFVCMCPSTCIYILLYMCSFIFLLFRCWLLVMPVASCVLLLLFACLYVHLFIYQSTPVPSLIVISSTLWVFEVVQLSRAPNGTDCTAKPPTKLSMKYSRWSSKQSGQSIGARQLDHCTHWLSFLRVLSTSLAVDSKRQFPCLATDLRHGCRIHRCKFSCSDLFCRSVEISLSLCLFEAIFECRCARCVAEASKDEAHNASCKLSNWTIKAQKTELLRTNYWKWGKQ